MIDYFDASAVAALLFSEPDGEKVTRFLANSEAEAAVSDFGIAEMSSAISRLVRMNQRTSDEGAELLENLDDWVGATPEAYDLEPGDIAAATALVRRFDLKLRAPDALHLAICRRLEARLITLDSTLADAAKTIGVTTINPGATA